jgi:hypothetical protein
MGAKRDQDCGDTAGLKLEGRSQKAELRILELQNERPPEAAE